MNLRIYCSSIAASPPERGTKFGAMNLITKNDTRFKDMCDMVRHEIDSSERPLNKLSPSAVQQGRWLCPKDN